MSNIGRGTVLDYQSSAPGCYPEARQLEEYQPSQRQGRPQLIVRVNPNVAQGHNTQIIWTVQEINSGFSSLGGGNQNWQVPVSGFYDIFFSAQFPTAPAAGRTVNFVVIAAAVAVINVDVITDGSAKQQLVHARRYLEKGEAVGVSVFTSDLAPITLGCAAGGVSQGTCLKICLV